MDRGTILQPTPLGIADVVDEGSSTLLNSVDAWDDIDEVSDEDEVSQLDPFKKKALNPSEAGM